MSDTVNTTHGRTLYFTQYRRGTPSNTAGRQVGWGLTPATARAACEPWANQAAYLSPRCGRVTVWDGVPGQDARAVWDALGINVPADIQRAIDAGQLATAVGLAQQHGLIA